MLRPHMLARGRPALGEEVLPGALVSEDEGFEVAAPPPDWVGVPFDMLEDVEEAEPEGAAEPDGAAPAPVPGRTW